MPSGVPIVGLGAGGHARSVLEALRSVGAHDVVALVDDDPRLEGTAVLGVPVTTRPEALASLRADGVRHAFVGVGGVTDRETRRRVATRLVDAGFELPPVIHASAAVSAWAQVGDGTQVLAMSLVNAGTTLGARAIVNSGAIVDHDCVIGAGAHIAPRAVIGGDATVGDDAHVGMGAVVIEGLRIGAGALVAAGAVVVADVPDGARVAGVPARPMAG